MHVPVLSSTILLTILLAIGLVFFIRASTKDRIQVARLLTDQPQTTLLERLQTYFTQRAYRIATVNADRNQVIYEGFVRPSRFLAVFLTLLAAIGVLCLSLVLALLFPDYASLFPAMVLVSPVAGVFYWLNAGRPEKVALQVETVSAETAAPQSLVIVTAHRDELAELQRALDLKPVEE